jgi:hypothetical protein
MFEVAEINEPNDSSMSSAESDREFAEIFVERDKHLAVA